MRRIALTPRRRIAHDGLPLSLCDGITPDVEGHAECDEVSGRLSRQGMRIARRRAHHEFAGRDQRQDELDVAAQAHPRERGQPEEVNCRRLNERCAGVHGKCARCSGIRCGKVLMHDSLGAV